LEPSDFPEELAEFINRIKFKCLKFDQTRKNEDDVRIRTFFYKSLDFSMFTFIDTIELGDSHFNYDDIVKHKNYGIKTLIITGGLCIRLEN
jgi:hypothetical protein